ncbi:hypothetical protein [Pleurocapsa sp. PCC 7319]|uniref:hypothetical protein n=1 Tax=Pleurocapsa sp. PCC 7319 TaxID=118161 RepID=UPI0003475EAD|nr:hypothetical protein [Pleurocapsa sp. PCC 7319]
MAKYQKSFVKLITSWAIAIIISFLFIFPATALTQDLQFNGSTGYQVKARFSYNKTQTPEMIAEHGLGKTQVLDSMEVNFYDPSGEIIETYKNIVDGVATGTYFEFNFDPVTQQILGNIDLGGESAGEIYLKGNIDRGISLIEVEASGVEKVIDQIKGNQLILIVDK